MNKAPVTGPKEMEICELSKIQNNPFKKFRKIKETICKTKRKYIVK